ncbi:ABC transporter permease [Cellulosilyticum ruminicola]|uniref:ABC transporter permease n=1 Tax=Cellulosilyticum ruminicola TaxID=425254 RepID=UPI0006CFEF2D|nr:ABC transporter permease [Cellulosilyticum ruminicola]
MKRNVKLIEYVEYFLPLVLLLTLWHFATSSETYSEVLFPKLTTIIDTFIRKTIDLSLPSALGTSLLRVLKGYLLAAVSGISMGILIGLSNRFQKCSDLLIQLLKPIPPIAWIPLVILWAGIGEASKVFLIFIGGFFPVLLNVIDGIRYTDKKLLEVASVMETPRKKYIFKLIIPAAFPSIFTGLRVAMGSCWTCVVAAELVASSSGIGYMISNARNFGQMDVVIVGMISIGIVGKLMDVILREIGKRLLAWNL